MEKLQLGELLIEIDCETAQELKNDPEYALTYYRTLKGELLLDERNKNEGVGVASTSSNGCSTLAVGNKLCSLWKSSKNPTGDDHKATLKLLELREKFKEEFNDKKSVKKLLWAKIAKQMNESSYFVGEPHDAGAEKCRQKFANLQSSYISTNDRRKKTGEGAVKNPPYYDEVDNILGDKHKVSPVLIIDSASADSSESSTDRYGSGSKENPPEKPNRFNNIKCSVRPSRSQVLQELLDLQKENQKKKSEEFKAMIDLINRQNDQRHEQMLALLNNPKKRKRPHHSSDED